MLYNTQGKIRMKRKDVNYKYARENIYNKDIALNNYIDNMLVKTNQMFHYDGLPNTVPKRILERFLTESGYCVFTKIGDSFYVFNGAFSGKMDAYGEPTQITVSNPYINVNREFTIGVDCVLIRNDSRMTGLIPLISKYAVLCNDCEISINMITNILRSQVLISAGDAKTKENADLFIQKLMAGDFSCVAENGFIEGLKVQNFSTNANTITQFIELNQYLRAIAYNEVGLDANYNMKRERLNESEIEMNSSMLIPLADEMMEQRQNAVKEINEMYGLQIKVDLSSVWKMQHESVDKATETENTETEQDKENSDLNDWNVTDGRREEAETGGNE